MRAQKILVPYDFSETADAALAWAAELRASTGGPPLQIIHVVSFRSMGVTPEMTVDPIPPTVEEIRDLERELLQAAERHGAPAHAQVLVRPDSVDQIILAAAAQLNADLIVMGTHGKTGVRRLVLGSVAEQVIRHADCPVVTVRGRR
jgi:nucleotide-binding universal stress UspA family protein